jgi:hypothetical protein
VGAVPGAQRVFPYAGVKFMVYDKAKGVSGFLVLVVGVFLCGVFVEFVCRIIFVGVLLESRVN